MRYSWWRSPTLLALRLEPVSRVFYCTSGADSSSEAYFAVSHERCHSKGNAVFYVYMPLVTVTVLIYKYLDSSGRFKWMKMYIPPSSGLGYHGND